jgi:hypothetical protein
VPGISISKSASAKILEEEDNRFEALERPMVPRLLYYHRSYSKLNRGRIREYGPVLIFLFIGRDEADDEWYLSVDIGNECRLVIGPATFFQVGEQSIDWADQKFKLESRS